MSSEAVQDTERAWLLPLRGGVRAAAAEYELLEVIPQPRLEGGMGEEATLAWRDRRLPVVDPAAPFHRETEAPWAAVARALDPEGTVVFAALPLAAPPQAVTVHDGLACEPPQGTLREHLVWSQFALGAFRDGTTAVPILDLGRVFSAPGRARLARYAGAATHPCPAEAPA